MRIVLASGRRPKLVITARRAGEHCAVWQQFEVIRAKASRWSAGVAHYDVTMTEPFFLCGCERVD